MFKLTALADGQDRLEDLSIIHTRLKLLGLGRDRAELMLEARCSATTVESTHHVVLRFADGSISDGHEEDRNTIGWHHLLTGGAVVRTGFRHVVG